MIVTRRENMEIGKQIKMNRTMKKLTQQQVAEKLNVTRSTISNWETGRTYPDLTSLLRISELFEVTVDQLLKGDEKMVELMNKDLLLGKKLKKIFFGVVVPSLMLVILLSGLIYYRDSLQSVKLADISNIKVQQNKNMAWEIKGTAQISKFEKIEAVDAYEIDNNLYLLLQKVKAIKGDNTFSYSYTGDSNKLEKIILVGESFDQQEGFGLEEIKNSSNQKIVWKSQN